MIQILKDILYFNKYENIFTKNEREIILKSLRKECDDLINKKLNRDLNDELGI
jgi:hypothetical protein